MTNFIITFRYIIKVIAVFAAVCTLSGCLGGSIAQQLARTIATSVADKVVANAMDVQDGRFEQDSQINNITLKNADPNDYWYTVANSNFEPVKAIPETLPTHADYTEIAGQAVNQTEYQQTPFSKPADEIETPVQTIQSSQLVRVELFNLLIGDEKNAVYEQARLMGATSLPQKREWQFWAVATGVVERDKKMITFLIPPQFGKLPSGAVAVVELASPGELNVVRYKAN